MKRYVTCVVLLSLAIAALAAAPAHALVPSGPGWFWQAPQPVGGWMADVAYGGAQNIWAVGGGSINHSADGGASWQRQASIARAELESVAFGDGQHGLACGIRMTSSNRYGPLLLRTDDGGATWIEATPPGVLYSLGSLSMSDPSHAWMTDEGGRLWTTADGGLTWAKHTRGAYRGRLVVSTLDGRRGWAGDQAGVLWRTTNGGASWTKHPIGLPPAYSVTELQTSSGHIWVLAVDEVRPVPRYRLIVSPDKGSSWQLVRSMTGYIADLTTSGEDAWLLSSLLSSPPGAWEGAAPTAVELRHTTDGGAHWTRSVINSASSPYALAANGSQLCAVGAGTFTSDDDGRTWTARTTSRTYMITAAQAVSSGDVWAVDETGSLLHSSDGVRWAEQDLPRRRSQSFSDLSFADAEHGWLVGTKGRFFDDEPLILATSDAGQTWSSLFSPLGGMLTAVDFVDELHGWVGGGGGLGPAGGRVLMRTTDGGQQWSVLQPDPNLEDVKLLDFIDSQTGWVSGYYIPPDFHSGEPPDGLFRTSDGGSSWTYLPLPNNTHLAAMQFLDASEGWAVAVRGTTGANRSVLHTSDGGASWTAEAPLEGLLTEAVHFLDRQTGWVSAYGDGIYETRDAGASWQRVSDCESSSEIAAADAEHVWALGWSIVGTVDFAGDAAPPTTWTDADNNWHRTAQTINFHAADLGGSGLAGTEYSLDEGKTWQPGNSISFDAPADHSGDGVHGVLYRSRDAAGNREASMPCAAVIDTLGPACAAPKTAVVNAGSRGILRFHTLDATSGVKRATITVSGRNGKVVKRFVQHAGNWSSEPAPKYFWLRFTCNLKPGYYRITVKALDYAGNLQTKVGRNLLHVVRSGAPKQVRPWWPAGLPGSDMTGASGAASSGVSLPARGRAAELLSRHLTD